jgi:hypothetical protein
MPDSTRDDARQASWRRGNAAALAELDSHVDRPIQLMDGGAVNDILQAEAMGWNAVHADAENQRRLRKAEPNFSGISETESGFQFGVSAKSEDKARLAAPKDANLGKCIATTQLKDGVYFVFEAHPSSSHLRNHMRRWPATPQHKS